MFHRATLQDVVPVKSNPAYEQVNLKRIETKKNNAYSTVYLPAAAPQYENAVVKLNAWWTLQRDIVMEKNNYYNSIVTR